MESTEGKVETQALRFDRVIRAHEVTNEGSVAVSVQVRGTVFRVEMSLEQAADLVDGLTRSVQVLRARQS